ncbi:MAG: multiheme c-type cytochrome [bacterium]
MTRIVPSRPRRPSAFLAAFVALAAVVALTTGCSDRGDGSTGPDPEPTIPGPFAAAATCGACHPQHFAEWTRSMHAFAGSDPAMIAQSLMASREGGDAIGSECRNCHAPSLVRQERWVNSLPPGSNPVLADLSHDGISCDFCHSIQVVPPVGRIDWFDTIDPADPKLGSIVDPVANDFHESRHDDSFRTSAQCASCHQIHLADGTGIENTHREWETSILSGMGIECQECHMPAYDGPAATTGPVRRVHRHEFVGVDYLTVDFRDADRARQLESVRSLLANSVTVTSTVPSSVASADTMAIEVRVLNNLTGHSIPSGTSFSRDMWIQVTVRDAGDSEIYRSGWLEADGELVAPATDPDLVRFGSTLFDADGHSTPFSWRAVSIDESELLPFGATRVATYAIPVPPAATGPLTVDLALRFRPMKPSILRASGLEDLLPVEIFEMWSTQETVAIEL